MLKVRQANLVNLMLEQPLVPELLGHDCTPDRLAAAVATLIRDEAVRAAHMASGYDSRGCGGSGAGGVSPSLKAADKILSIIAARRQT